MLEEQIVWARETADRLDAVEAGESIAACTGALAFLKLVDGEGEFYRTADGSHYSSSVSRARGFAKLLREWADFAESGMAQAVSPAVAARQEAATDLMEQVRTLLEDGKTHPAAAVMLAGAALEEALRSMIMTYQVEVPARATIGKYASALRQAKAISAQQKKDIDAWGGLRNAAAHGHFDDIEQANAILMEQGINLFLQQLDLL